MASHKIIFFSIFIIYLSPVESASIFERSYDYVVSLGKNLAPNFMSVLDCLGEDDVWLCAKERAGKILESWDTEVDKQRRMWQDAADAEITSSGRSIEELPSKLGTEVEQSLASLADLVNHGVARALSRHHEGGGIDSITISTGDKKKKMKKKKPPKIHLVHPMMMAKDEDRGLKPIPGASGANVNESENIAFGVPVSDSGLAGIAGKEETGFQNSNFNLESDSIKLDDSDVQNSNLETVESSDDLRSEIGVGDDARKGRGMFADIWSVGEKAIDAVAEHAIEHENSENEVSDKSSIEENRGKKKKKKKAILKLLILGAVLKAKIGTLLQILSFKLQVKFFLIALIGLGINLARFWIDLKKQHAPPQKVIYYEHAQHQHHYDHEHEEEHGWGPWSRSADNEETDGEIDASVLPYKAQVVRNPQAYTRAAHSRV